jgi:hypothetical protein
LKPCPDVAGRTLKLRPPKENEEKIPTLKNPAQWGIHAQMTGKRKAKNGGWSIRPAGRKHGRTGSKEHRPFAMLRVNKNGCATKGLEGRDGAYLAFAVLTEYTAASL